MAMTPAEFISVCEAIYGAGWQSKLARHLVREPRTIRRWKSGESPVPKKVQDWLRMQETRTTTNRKER